MTKRFTAGFVAIGLLLGAGQMVFANSSAGAEVSADARAGSTRSSVFIRIAANFEDRMEKLRERFEREQEKLEERMEKKREQVNEKFERERNKFEVKTEKKVRKIEHRPPVHATSTVANPLILEVGPKGQVFMRGFVTANASSTINVRSWGGVWDVRTASTTRLLASATTTADFLVGDYVGVQGVVNTSSSLSIDATVVRDRTP